jgi:hypothetical protein
MIQGIDSEDNGEFAAKWRWRTTGLLAEFRLDEWANGIGAAKYDGSLAC